MWAIQAAWLLWEWMVVMTNGKNGQAVINRILQDIVGGYYPGLKWLHG
jgi:hypothetical protein